MIFLFRDFSSKCLSLWRGFTGRVDAELVLFNYRVVNTRRTNRTGRFSVPLKYLNCVALEFFFGKDQKLRNDRIRWNELHQSQKRTSENVFIKIGAPNFDLQSFKIIFKNRSPLRILQSMYSACVPAELIEDEKSRVLWTTLLKSLRATIGGI